MLPKRLNVTYTYAGWSGVPVKTPPSNKLLSHSPFSAGPWHGWNLCGVHCETQVQYVVCPGFLQDAHDQLSITWISTLQNNSSAFQISYTSPCTRGLALREFYHKNHNTLHQYKGSWLILLSEFSRPSTRISGHDVSASVRACSIVAIQMTKEIIDAGTQVPSTIW